MLTKKIACFVIAAGITLCSAFSKSRAAEYGFTAYPLGSYSFDAGITPPPGWYVTDAIAFYSGNIGGAFDFGGRAFNAGVKADIFSNSVNVLFVPKEKVLDGYFGASMTVPAAFVDYRASGTGPRGNIITLETDGTGLGDMNFQLQLGWDGEVFSHTFYFLTVAPTGRYSRGLYPIAGLNRPSFDLGWAFTVFDKNTKLQFNGAVGFMTSIENHAIQYQTGDEFHFEWAIGYKFDNGLEIGIVGYDYRQVSGDSGRGAVLGPFEGVVDAIGPGLTYTTKIADTPVTISARDYIEYNTKHRFEGNLAIAEFTVALGAK